MTRPRAAIVVTGSELVRGDRQDRNGPFLAAEVVRLGLDPTRIAIVGDRAEEMGHALFAPAVPQEQAGQCEGSVVATTPSRPVPPKQERGSQLVDSISQLGRIDLAGGAI